MTLAVVIANADQIIQVNDRRITSGYQIIDDSVSKGGHAICDDASFLYCFTGLATVGSAHITSRWLPEALYNAAQRRGHSYPQIVHGLAEEAHSFFQASPILKKISDQDRRLTIMLTGYMADGYLVNSLISNFQDFERYIDSPEAHEVFQFTTWRSQRPAPENPTLIQAIGQFHALTSDDEAQLRIMLEERAPAEALRQKAISLIQEVSDRPRTNGTVGKKLNTSRLDYNSSAVPVVGYASDEAENKMHFIDQVDIRTGSPKILIADVQISADFPITFPRVHRNAPCPCGSGQKYRFCHRN